MSERPATMTGTFVGGLRIEADANGERRILAGLAVPYNEVGQTSWGAVKFLPGSLGSAKGIPAVRAHDDDRIIGLVQASEDSAGGVDARIKVSKVSAGDEVLILADDGALTGLSGSWRPTEYSFEADDTYGEVVVISAAEWVHLSVVARPAFDSARITHVAASRPASERTTDVAETPTPTEAAAVVATPILTVTEIPGLTDAVAAMNATATSINTALEAIVKRDEAQAAAAATVPLDAGNGPRPKPFKNVGEFAFSLLKSQRGDDVAKARITAALAEAHKGDLQAALDETTTALNTGLVPPVYTSEVLGGLPVSTPILTHLVRHAPLPDTGMSMIKPEWSVLPNGDWISTENTEPASDAVAVGTQTVNVLTWGHAVKASINLLERSAFGGFAQNYFDQARISFTSDHEAKAKEVMFAAADSVLQSPNQAITALATIAQLVEYLIENQRDANGNFRGLAPDFVGMSANEFGGLIQTDGFKPFVQGDASWGTMMGMVGGITAILLPSLNSGDYLAGARAATVVYDGQPIELRATVVNTMSIELGVIANTAVDVEYPDALVKVTFGS